MKNTIEDFFNMLFDEGEYTCFAKHAKGTRVFKVEDYDTVMDWVQYFTINPLDGNKDHKPVEEYHAPDKPRRADCNVIVFRNIMLEIDDIPIKDQWEFIKEIKLPYTTAVYSGGKSIHFVISLEQPCTDYKDYQKLVSRFYKALKKIRPGVVDAANKNPSRCSRVPFTTRHETGKPQQLLNINDRIHRSTLESWIEEYIGPEVENEERESFSSNPTYTLEYLNYINDERAKYGLEPIKSTLSGFTKNFLMFGADEGERNLSVFRAACDFAKCGYDQDDALDQIIQATDLEESEVERTVRSAYLRVENEDF